VQDLGARGDGRRVNGVDIAVALDGECKMVQAGRVELELLVGLLSRHLPQPDPGSDFPRSRPVRRCGAISFGGTRTNDSPIASSARSNAPVN